jgi:hypothetical protein
MNATQWAAWVGACTGVVGFGWQVFTWVRTGPRLILKALANQFKPERFEGPGHPPFLRITVENRGTAPTTIKSLTVETYLSRWARFRRRGSTLGEYEGPKLPHKLEIGGDFVIQIRQREEFNNWISSGNLWCAVEHSVSGRPVLAKILLE